MGTISQAVTPRTILDEPIRHVDIAPANTQMDVKYMNITSRRHRVSLGCRNRRTIVPAAQKGKNHRVESNLVIDSLNEGAGISSSIVLPSAVMMFGTTSPGI